MPIEVKIEDALCFNLYSASRAMTQVYRPYLDRLGLTYPQFLVMLLLWERRDQDTTPKDLGKRLYLESGTLTPLLRRLESAGLIIKSKSIKDEREVLVSLSPKGKKLEKKCEDIPVEMFCNLSITPEDFVKIRDGVANVLKNLNNKIEEFKG